MDAWREKGIDIHTNSQFGIGVFSYFLVADELEVESARLGPSGETPSLRLLLRIPTASSFFRIVAMSDDEARAARRLRAEERGDTATAFLDAGTRVRLWLRWRDEKNDVFNVRASCVDAIREDIWFSEIDVEARDDRGQKFPNRGKSVGAVDFAIREGSRRCSAVLVALCAAASSRTIFRWTHYDISISEGARWRDCL